MLHLVYWTGMPQRLAVIAVLAMLVLAIGGLAQHSATTTLALVVPEAWVQPQQVPLTFQVSADGAADIVSQGASVAAGVRALPGEAIRVTMQLANLQGPGKSGLRRQSAMERHRGPRHRRRAGGSVHFRRSDRRGSRPGPGEGWQKSGTVECAVTRQLADPRSLPPGRYSDLVQITAASH
jgi:hypothetical protein